jgi:hypothetical protein
MLSAKLIKALEKKGFFLEFPDYNSLEELIIDIIKENNKRLNLSLSLLLKEHIDYTRIRSNLDASRLKEFNKIILISKKIYNVEGVSNNLIEIINKTKINGKFSDSEFKEYYDSFKESVLSSLKEEQKTIEKQSKLRLNLDFNKSLQILFSPAKIRIMKKIFNHEAITNTELKYYYRSISNINKAVLNLSLQDYLRIVEITRKISSVAKK